MFIISSWLVLPMFPPPSLPHQAPQSLIYFLSAWLCLSCVVHVMEASTAWVLSDSPHSELRVSQVYLHPAACQAHVPTSAERCCPVWMCTAHFFISCHPSGLFPLSGFVNNTARNIHVQGDQTTLHLKNTIAYRITGKLLAVPPQLHPCPNLQAHLLHAISCLYAIFMLFLILVDSAPHLLQSLPQILTHPSRPCSVVYLFFFSWKSSMNSQSSSWAKCLSSGFPHHWYIILSTILYGYDHFLHLIL